MAPADTLHRLDEGEARTVRDLVAGLGLQDARAPGERPRVVADMIAAVDGRASIDGRSVGLGHPADRALLRELRAGADAILVGAPTIRAERYANLLDADQRAARVAAGRPAHPLVATVSRGLDLPLDVPLFSEEGIEIVVYSESEMATPEVTGATLEVVRSAPGTLTLPALMDDLGARGIRSVLCEGGPTLLRELVAQGAVDDLLLTVAPLVVGGGAASIVEGAALAAPRALALREIHRAGEHLFLHYVPVLTDG
ncbi:MAG TPA: dihydrofolate reductase family protein [Baekduia sp.]